MSLYLAIGYLDGEVTDVVSTWMTSEPLETHFPIGEVYRYAEEPGGFAWRVLQRGTEWVTREDNSRSRMGPALLPIKAEEVPDAVRMIALMSS